MYIDPAAGSMLLQIVAAAALSSIAFTGRLRQRVRRFFSSLFTRDSR
jgi:hypothetical protein